MSSGDNEFEKLEVQVREWKRGLQELEEAALSILCEAQPSRMDLIRGQLVMGAGHDQAAPRPPADTVEGPGSGHSGSSSGREQDCRSSSGARWMPRDASIGPSSKPAQRPSGVAPTTDPK